MRNINAKVSFGRSSKEISRQIGLLDLEGTQIQFIFMFNTMLKSLICDHAIY